MTDNNYPLKFAFVIRPNSLTSYALGSIGLYGVPQVLDPNTGQMLWVSVYLERLKEETGLDWYLLDVYVMKPGDSLSKWEGTNEDIHW